MEMLLCYEDEGVYVNTYGRITKDVVLQWGEMPTSVGRSHTHYIHNSHCHPHKHYASHWFIKYTPQYLSLVPLFTLATPLPHYSAHSRYRPLYSSKTR